MKLDKSSQSKNWMVWSRSLSFLGALWWKITWQGIKLQTETVDAFLIAFVDSSTFFAISFTIYRFYITIFIKSRHRTIINSSRK